MSDLEAGEEEEVDVRAEMQVVKRNNSKQSGGVTVVSSITVLTCWPLQLHRAANS